MRYWTAWRFIPHQHTPWHPGPYELWRCADCRTALNWEGWRKPPRWHPFWSKPRSLAYHWWRRVKRLRV